MATSGEKRWPPVGNFVAASGEKPMAIDTGKLARPVLMGARRRKAPGLPDATIRERDGAGVIAFIDGGASSQRLRWRLPVLAGGSCRATALLG